MRKRDILLGLLAAAIVAAFSFFSSHLPDAIEKTVNARPQGNYFPLSGIAGVILVFLLVVALARMLRNKK